MEREEKLRRIVVANAALQCFAADTEIVEGSRGLAVRWQQWRGGTIERRWLVSGGQSFYPVWHHKWAHGGTACTALANLVRWIQGRPVLPLSTWRYWASQKIHLMRDRGGECLQILEAGEYPQHAECVLCGVGLESFDWWHLNGVSGPCCRYTEGCRQKVTANAG